MSFVSRWPVLKTYAVTVNDLDPGGLIRDDVMARWIDEAVSAYLSLCTSLPPAAARRLRRLPAREELGRPERVAVSAGAKEIRRGSFTVGIRLRPIHGGDPKVFDTACEIELPTGVTEAIRDQLIALEHAAHHVN